MSDNIKNQLEENSNYSKEISLDIVGKMNEDNPTSKEDNKENQTSDHKQDKQIEDITIQNNVAVVETPKYTTIIDKVIEESGYNTYNLRIFLILSLFFLADGGEMVVISLIVSELETVWNLSSSQKGFIGSAVFIGFYFGALVGGKISDNKGRLPTFLMGSLIVFIFGVISAFSPNYWFLVFMRAFFGFGVGISIPASTSLLSEIVPFNQRSCILTMVWFSFPIGETLAILFAKTVLVYEDGWRYLLFFVAIPSLISIIITLFMIESPRYYFTKGNYDKASDILDKILISLGKPKLTQEQRQQMKDEGKVDHELHKNNENDIKKETIIRDIHEISARVNELEESLHHSKRDSSIKKNFENKEKKQVNEVKNQEEIVIKEQSKPQENRNKSDFKVLFNTKYIALTLSVGFIFFTCSFVYYGIVFILPQNLSYIAVRGEVREALKYYNNTIKLQTYVPHMNISNINISELYQDDDLVEKLSILKNFTKNELPDRDKQDESDVLNGLILSVLIELPSNFVSVYLANHPKLGRIKSMMYGFLITGFSSLLCLIFIDYISIFAALLKFSICIPFSIIYIYVCESYPTSIRSLAVGFSNSFNRLAGILTPLICQLLFSIKVSFPYLSFVLLSCSASFITFRLKIETLGRKLEDK